MVRLSDISAWNLQERMRTGDLSKSVNSNRSPSKLLNLNKNRTPGHMVSNNDLCLRSAVQYMLLFLVLAVNSDRFQILHALTQAARSYSLLGSVLGTTCCHGLYRG